MALKDDQIKDCILQIMREHEDEEINIKQVIFTLAFHSPIHIFYAV